MAVASAGYSGKLLWQGVRDRRDVVGIEARAPARGPDGVIRS